MMRMFGRYKIRLFTICLIFIVVIWFQMVLKERTTDTENGLKSQQSGLKDVVLRQATKVMEKGFPQEDHTPTINVTVDNSLQYYRNVCVDPKDIGRLKYYPFIAQLQVFDQRHAGRSRDGQRTLSKTRINMSFKDNYWSLSFKNTAVPNEWPLVDAVAFFPAYWRDSNVRSLLYEHTLPPLYLQKSWSEQALISLNTSQPSQSVLIAPTLVRMRENIQNIVKRVGYTDIVPFIQLLESGPICFKHAIFGSEFTNQLNNLSEFNIKSALFEQLHIKEACKHKDVVILQRTKSRKICNIQHIELGLDKTGCHNFRIEEIEGKDIKSILESIKCASVLISTVSSGLAWQTFLPQNSVYIELNNTHWLPKEDGGASAARLDIDTRVINCNAVIADKTWLKYAQEWLNYSGDVVTYDIKKRLITHSASVTSAQGNIWLDSDVVCPVDDIVTSVMSLPNSRSRCALEQDVLQKPGLFYSNSQS